MTYDLDATSRLSLLKQDSLFADLSDCDLNHFVDVGEICNFKKLQYIDLSHNDISWVPFDVAELPNLARLDLDNNNIVGLPDALARLCSLQYLSLKDNMLSYLAPGNLDLAPSLRVLDLSRNQMQHLPKSFKSCKTIKYLNVDGNRFTNTLSDWLSHCTQLEVLSYQKLYFETEPLPSNFGQKNRSLRMVLGSKYLKNKLPFSIYKVKTLEFFDPGTWGEKPTLIPEFPRNSNQVPAMSNGVPQERHFRGDAIRKNYILKIDEEFEKIDIEARKKNAIFDWQLLGSTPMDSLSVLQLDNCCIEHIPEQFGLMLPNLELLDLSYNNIIYLPKTFTMMTKLSFLYINCNQIIELPQDIGNLKQLEEMHMACNNISKVPSSFRRLRDIEVVDLRNNPLNYCPPLFCVLSRLRLLGYPTMENFISIPTLKSFFRVRNAFLDGQNMPISESRLSDFYKVRKSSIIDQVLSKFEYSAEML